MLTAGDGAGNGKVPPAAPTDMFSTVRGTGYPRPAGMTSHSDGVATDNDRAAVVGTVATTDDSISDGAVATVGIDDTVIDGTVADTGAVKKRNFHTGLDPVSRENNCAQRTLSVAVAAAANSVGYAELFVLDTGSSPVWSAVADADATDDDRAIDTVTNPDDATVVTGGGENKIVIPAGRRNPDARTASNNGARWVDGELRRRQRDHRPPPAASLTAPLAQRTSPSPTTPTPLSPRATVVTADTDTVTVVVATANRHPHPNIN